MIIYHGWLNKNIVSVVVALKEYSVGPLSPGSEGSPRRQHFLDVIHRTLFKSLILYKECHPHFRERTVSYS